MLANKSRRKVPAFIPISTGSHSCLINALIAATEREQEEHSDDQVTSLSLPSPVNTHLTVALTHVHPDINSQNKRHFIRTSSFSVGRASGTSCNNYVTERWHYLVLFRAAGPRCAK